MRYILGVLLAIFMVGQVNAQPSRPVCISNSSIEKPSDFIRESFGEKTVWRAVSNTGNEMWTMVVNYDSGSWSLLLTTKNPDITCFVGTGTGFIDYTDNADH